MNRRSFLAGILAAGVAPAIVRADSLMRVVPWDRPVIEVLEPVVIDWRQMEPVWVECGADFKRCFDEVIAETIRRRSAQIAANVSMQNALLRGLRGQESNLRTPGYEPGDMGQPHLPRRWGV